MKKLSNPLRIALALAVAVVLFQSAVSAETIKKLHPSVQTVINRPSATVLGLSAGNITSQNVPVLDLSGGDYDKLSWAVYISSAAGAGTLTLTMSFSPDGGTSWIVKDVQTINPNGLTAITSSYANVAVSPGTKAKIVPTITTGCTFYGMKVFAMPLVD